MSDLHLDTAWTYHGLRVITLENSLLRLQILPEAGAKIWQITYKPLGADLLWNNPRIAPARHVIHTPYDDVWSGGWDELFPNDEIAIIAGDRFPDHGELWTAQWTSEPFSHKDTAGVTLRTQTPIGAISVEKTIVLQSDSPIVQFHHCFENNGAASFPFLWMLHPAFEVTANHRIDFPKMRVTREPAFPGTLHDAPLEFDWPYAQLGSRKVDLREIPDRESRAVHFFYGSELETGWCALTNTANQLACGLRFDANVFRSCWLFASYGGWRDYNVAVLEPCTGYPLNFDALVASNRHQILLPGEKLETDALFTVSEGVRSVSYIDADGTIMEEPVQSSR